MEIKFPEIFIEPENVTYTDRRKAIADALAGWACCFSCCRNEIPVHFGVGMHKIYRYLKVPPVPQSILKLANELIIGG